MSKVILLKELKAFTLDVTRDLIFPVAQQKEDKEPPKPRAAEVFCTRLPDSKSAKKKAPYILHQFINDKTIQPKDQRLNSTAVDPHGSAVPLPFGASHRRRTIHA